MKHGNLKRFLFLISFFYSFNVFADLIEGDSVSIQILDKITSKIKNIEVDVNQFKEYGTLKIEIFACYKKPPEETPDDLVLLRIFDFIIENEHKKIFQGWMISSSPSSTPFEHPIYDLWIKECKISSDS